MRADTSLRPAYDPRSLAMASGERLPEGHSNMRVPTRSPSPRAMDQKHLTTAQEQRHHYRAAMAGYVQYLAATSPSCRRRSRDGIRTLRAELQVAGSHQREPGNSRISSSVSRPSSTSRSQSVPSLLMSARSILARARQVLLGQAREHAQAQAEEASEQVFLRYLKDGLAGKRAYVEDKQGGAPDDAGLWGWEHRTRLTRSVSSRRRGAIDRAHLIGVLDGAWLLLYPEPVYQFVVGAAKAAGRVFPVDQASSSIASMKPA